MISEIVRRADEPEQRTRPVEVDTIEALEEVLISADVGVAATDRIVAAIRGRTRSGESLRDLVKQEIRDLAAVQGQPIAYVCTERGQAIRLDTESGKILGVYESERGEPLWSLAYNHARGLLATAERRGELVVLDCATMRPIFKGGFRTGRPKRMKWCDDTLFYVQTGQLRRFDLASRKIEPHVADCENTIEDFIWDEGRQYLVLVGYRTEVVLCDFRTGTKLAVAPDQADFSKGLAWVSPHKIAGGYPLDFVTFGRSGTAHLFRIHNERCLALGPIAVNLLGPES